MFTTPIVDRYKGYVLCVYIRTCACEQLIYSITPLFIRYVPYSIFITFTLNALYTPCVCMCIYDNIIIMKVISYLCTCTSHMEVVIDMKLYNCMKQSLELYRPCRALSTSLLKWSNSNFYQ